jgi:hypothetical protein
LALWWISVLQAVQGFVLRCTRVAHPATAARGLTITVIEGADVVAVDTEIIGSS